MGRIVRIKARGSDDLKTETIVRHSIGSTDGDAAYRRAAWQEVMGTSGEVVMTPEQAERFASDSAWRRMGPLMIGRVAAGDFRIVRTREAAQRIGLDHVFINYVVSGRVHGVCGRRRMDLSAGSLGIIKASSPSDLTAETIVWTAIVAQRHVIEAAVGAIGHLDGRTFGPGSSQAMLIGAHIEALLALPDPLSAAEATRAGRACLSILAACFERRAAAPTGALDQDAETAKAIRRFIDARLADSDLGPATLCREFGLSRSRLYRVMGATGDVAAAIRRLRLARAHRAIASRRLDDVPMAEIATRFGFGQERSFRRAFQQAFGYSASDLRENTRRGTFMALPEAGATIEEWLKSL